MTTSFITFMYGLAMPILFPIAAITFLNLYIVEKLLLSYWYQNPPTYDDKLNKAALNYLKWPPVLLLFFGYWWMG
eukprot:CAMPEP_0116881782 /NCGR_PEP_ID=MMETSP0463-20121206/13840_1 /TAXON_ID=181622 /ORGANISM="Strombidinopsis sp, Strain SopsisLIS2011" /LENGTH=74 /DNA_ID=CAMNT_0004533963 /DNA_START=2417 /DNA_END=2641 /DNA_ORIENTATION=-